MPTMNATNRSADRDAERRVSKACDQADAHEHLQQWQQISHSGQRRLRQQLVGAYGAHAPGRVGELEQVGDEPDTPGDQAHDEAGPRGVRLLHGADPRAGN